MREDHAVRFAPSFEKNSHDVKWRVGIPTRMKTDWCPDHILGSSGRLDRTLLNFCGNNRN